MRVLHVFAGNMFGGIERVGITLASHRALCEDMDPVFAACFEGRLTEELRETGVPVHILGDVKLSRPWTLLRARKNLKKLLKSESFDLVLCHACWPYVVAAPVARAMKLPVVFWAHDILTGKHFVETWAGRTSPDLVLSNSAVTARSIPAIFPGAKIEAQYYPVPKPPQKDRVATRKRVRKEMGVTDQQTVIITACRLERWKGHSLLLEALGKIRRSDNWVCWIAGGAQRESEQLYLDELSADAQSSGIDDRVKFLGQRSDVYDLMAAADIHCQPNTGPEPFGVAFVEALYAGLPVVTTAMGGPLEIVNSDCGILTPPGDATELATALKKLIDDPQLRATLSQAGPEQAAAICDVRDTLHDLRRKLEILRPVEAV